MRVYLSAAIQDGSSPADAAQIFTEDVTWFDGFGFGVSWLRYPLCGETLEPLARFVRKLPKDSNLAEDSFPGLINQEFLGSFSTDKSICSLASLISWCIF
jgi:hypothetical protein